MLFGLFATLSLTLDVQLSTSLTRLQIGPGPHGPAALLEGAPRDRPGGGLQPFARPPAPSTCFVPLPESRGYPLTGQEESLLSQLFFVPRDWPLPFYKTVPASWRPEPTKRTLLTTGFEIRRVIKWGEGVAGIAESFFPCPQEWRLGDIDKPLDKITVRDLTGAFTRAVAKPPSCFKNGRVNSRD